MILVITHRKSSIKIWNALQTTEYKFREYHSAQAEKLCTENVVQELVMTHKNYITENFN